MQRTDWKEWQRCDASLRYYYDNMLFCYVLFLYIGRSFVQAVQVLAMDRTPTTA